MSSAVPTAKMKMIQKVTPPQAILEARRLGWPIAPHTPRLAAQFKRMSPEVEGPISYWHTNIGFVFEANGKPFGKSLEREFTHDGTKKTIIYLFGEEHQGLVETILLRKHGFIDGIPTIQLLDAKNGKEIVSLEETDEIQLKFNGEIYALSIDRRSHGSFYFNGYYQRSYLKETAALGLLNGGNRDCFPRNDLLANDSLDYLLPVFLVESINPSDLVLPVKRG